MLLGLIRIILIMIFLSIVSLSALRAFKIKLSDRGLNILALAIGLVTFLIQKLLKF